MAIRNLVFGGDGVDGTAYVGAIDALQDQLGGTLASIQRVAGTSAGSIVAMLVALNYTAEEIAAEYAKINFANIVNPNIISEIVNIFQHESINDNVKLRAAIEKLITDKLGNANITFGELSARGYKDLHVVTTRLETQAGFQTIAPHFFSAIKTPHTKLADAILASSSIPLLFPQVFLAEASPGHWVISHKDDPAAYSHVDGGLVRDLALQAFDRLEYLPGVDEKTAAENNFYNAETLGFITYPDNSKKPADDNYVQPLPRSEVSFFKALVQGVLGNKNVSPKNLPRTVLINDHGILSTNFAINAEQKQSLILAGREAVMAYFKKYIHSSVTSLANQVATLFSSPRFKPQTPPPPPPQPDIAVTTMTTPSHHY
jgi:NTE family protein